MLPITIAEQLNNGNGEYNQNIAAKSAQAFPGLTGWVAELLLLAGVSYISIGGVVVVAGYVVYRVSESVWTYYRLYSYERLAEHAYRHINDFANIWRTGPTKKQFEKECKKIMNSGSSRIKKFIDTSNRRIIRYNPETYMVVVGEVDGKTIVTCYKEKDIASKTRGKTPAWKEIK